MSSQRDIHAHIKIVPFDKHICTTVGNIIYGVLINLLDQALSPSFLL